MSRFPLTAACAAGLLLAVLLQGCASTLPVAVKPVGCKVADSTLALQCAAPQPVADGISFGDVIGIGRIDRKSLLACQAHLQLALSLLRECRQAVDAYDKEVDRINGALQAQRR